MKFKGGVRHFVRIGNACLHRQDTSRFHEHRDVIKRNRDGHGLSALIVIVCIEVIPADTFRKINGPGFRSIKVLAPAIVHGICYGTDQQAFAEHVFHVERGRCAVGWEIEEQTADHRAVLLHDCACHGINIRHQSVARANCFCKRIVKRVARFSKIPDFTRDIGSMGTEHRQKRAELEPSDIKLAISRIVEAFFVVAVPEPFHRGIVAALTAPLGPVFMQDEKSTDVEGPVGQAAHRHVECFRDLLFQYVPSCGDIAGPENGPIFLTARVSGAGEIEDSAVRRLLSLVLEDPLRMGEGVEIGPIRAEKLFVFVSYQKITLPGLSLIFPVPVRSGKRLCGVAPPGIKASGEKFPAALFPVELPGFFVKGVIGREIIEKECEDDVIVAYMPDCHEAVAGIVAGRIKDRFHRPAFVLTNAKDGTLKGSGRSIDEYNMFEELKKCEDLLIRYGGHKKAAGLSIEKDKLKEFSDRINDNASLTQEDLTKKIWIDVPMYADYPTEKFIEELSALEPFGEGNKKPIFADKGLTVEDVRLLGENQNVLKMMMRTPRGKKTEAVKFINDRSVKLPQKGDSIRITYYPEINEFGGFKRIQLKVDDFEFET